MKLCKYLCFLCYIGLIAALFLAPYLESRILPLINKSETEISKDMDSGSAQDSLLSADNIVSSDELFDIDSETSTSGNSSQELLADYTHAFPDLYAFEESSSATLPEEEKIAYLTFDDGPSKNTGKILDILEKYNAKATFFVIGKDLSEEGIENMQRAASEGHAIGMHTYSHDYNKIYASVSDFLSDYDALRTKLEELLGFAPTIFRFPGGSYCSYGSSIRTELIDEMTRRGYTYYDWNVSAEDAVGTVTACSIRNNIFPKVYKVSSPVILMHDAPLNNLTVEMLPEIIGTLQAEGYRFETLLNREALHFGE